MSKTDGRIIVIFFKSWVKLDIHDVHYSPLNEIYPPYMMPNERQNGRKQLLVML